MCSHWSGALLMRWKKNPACSILACLGSEKKKKASKMRLFIESDKEKFKKCKNAAKTRPSFWGSF